MKKLHINILFLIFIITFLILISSSQIMASNDQNMLIYLDAGHGGFDGGATSLNKTVIEKDITLKAVLMLKDYLEKTGYKVKLTRSTDQALAKNKRDDILKRVKLINHSKCLIYITIHANSYQDHNVKGSQTFYSLNNPENSLLAKNIMSYLNLYDNKNKRVQKELTGKYLLDHTNKIGCLVELGFLTNEDDLNHLTNDESLSQMVLMIYLGILEYLSTKFGSI